VVYVSHSIFDLQHVAYNSNNNNNNNNNNKLSAKNKIQGIGSLAVPVLRYSFGIINWHQEEPQKLDRKTAHTIRKVLQCEG
jgi:hypothetical protein